MKNLRFVSIAFLAMFFVFTANAYAATTVTTPTELTAALSSAISGDIITVDGILGSTTEYTLYEVTSSNVTINGTSGNKIYGTFNLKGDNDTLDGLNVYNRGGGSDSLKNAVNVVSKSANITNCRFEMPNPDAVAAGGGVGNGVVVWPYGSATPNLNTTGNAFVGYGATVPGWSSTAILIAEEIDMSRVGMGGTTSSTITLSNEQSLATNNSFTGSYYDYVHSNWNGGYKLSYSKASNLAAFLDVMEDSSAGATVLLGSDITTTSQIVVNKALTIDGLGHTLFANVTNGSNSAMTITSSDVTIKNLVENGTGSTGIHGFNIYVANNVILDTVTSSNNNKSGITVNGSIVTVNNITTANNSWGGINVDLGNGVVGPATLTVNGTSSHTESTAIWEDDTTKAVSVIDTNHQYSHVDNGNTRVFSLLAVGQTTPDETGTATVTETEKEVVVTATTPVTIELGSVVGATINYDSLIDDVTGTGLIPETTLTSSIATVEIPADTTVTAAGWDGVMSAPTVGSTSGTAPASFSVGDMVIEMGSPLFTLTFDKAVKITLPGVTGRVGYKPAGSIEWHLISTQCTSATVPGITSGECYVADSGNTIIWTYHFTTFGDLDPISEVRSGGRSGANRIASSLPSQASPVAVGRVLGAETENAAAVAQQIESIKVQLRDLIRQLIVLLQAEINSMQ